MTRAMTRLRLTNSTARALWLGSHGLADTPTGALDLVGIIKNLGFVQLDTIQVVSRAHHHILWSRNQNYREPMLDRLLRKERQIFEHFTHDASVLPMDFLPMWQRQFERKERQAAKSNWFGKHLDPALIAEVTRRITDEGPLSTQDFNTKVIGEKGMWQRLPHKMVLDYLWYSGVLATTYREGFTKFYDLSERVFPPDLPVLADEAQIAQLCQTALDRIGFGTLGEIRKFWDACDVKDVAGWAQSVQSDLIEVEVEGADGSWTPALACSDIEHRVATLKTPTKRLRILNPFDPAIRDRKRLLRLFGFDYTVEMFVPAEKRQWGYYIFPLLEGNRLVGRAEVQGDRAKGTLTLSKLWLEKERLNTAKRRANLEAELTRLAKLAGLTQVIWAAE